MAGWAARLDLISMSENLIEKRMSKSKIPSMWQVRLEIMQEEINLIFPWGWKYALRI
jgi:hypothetical protein